MYILEFHEPLDAIGWALHVQLALLEAPWPLELLNHPQARLETCPEGKLLFRGLRVRMAINTGVPTEIIVSQRSACHETAFASRLLPVYAQPCATASGWAGDLP